MTARHRLVLGVAAAVLVALAVRLPIWQARLTAPQYPDGLSLSAYGDRVVGDLDEINELNHYVGIDTFSVEDAPEMALWVPTIGLALAGVVVATLRRSRPLGRLAAIGLWLIPVGALADIQFRLYQFGHGVEPTAAIRIDPFTPLVVGPTKVLNFTTWSFPGPALWCLFGAAFLVSAGPAVLRRLPSLARRIRDWWAGEDDDDEDRSPAAEAAA